jgi:regulator of sirC expression with transglutaminase-like and TPR domain
MNTTERIKALIKLLQTERQAYRTLLKEELAAAVRTAPAEVARVMAEGKDTAAPQIVLQTLEEICWEELSKEFAAFSAKISPDLEEGLALLSRFSAPTVTREDLTRELGTLEEALRTAVINAANVREKIQIFNRYLFTLKQFSVLPAVMGVRDTSFIRFLRTGKGSVMCMASLYVCLGRRMDIEIEMVDLAGRVLLLVKDRTLNDSFIVDPLDGGKILHTQDCKDYVLARAISWDNNLFTPLSSRAVVRRFIANMIFILHKLRDERALAYLRSYLDILTH